MEINLVQDASVTFRNIGVDKFCTLQEAVKSVSITLNHVTGSYTHNKLQNKLNSLLNIGKFPDSPISCSMRIGKIKDVTNDQIQIMWASMGESSFFRTISPQVKSSAGLQTQIQISDKTQMVSSVLPLNHLFQKDALSGILFHFGDVQPDLANKWKNENGEIGTVSAQVTLNLVFDEDFLTNHFADKTSPNHCLLALAKMLDNESECDTFIESASGTTVKCNRAFLAASCPYFEAMFQSGMEESIANQIKMTNMSEGEIRAFLGYLYKSDVKPALTNIQTAWTLLKEGNYYQLDSLVHVMREIMMIRKCEKYTVDLALEMLLFAKEVCGTSGPNGNNHPLKDVWNDVTLKAVLVLKWYSKERPLDILASEKYNKLHEETPQLAMKLHAKFFQYLDNDQLEKRLKCAGNFMD